jgi:protein-disulfide isomerase
MDTQTTPANANPSAPTGAPSLGRTGANPAEMPGLLKAVSQSAGVIEGSAGPIWTVYYDGNCDFCNQLWRNLRAPLAAGQIRVRWAPVAVIGPSSAGKAATLLQSDQPLTVLAHHGLNGERIAESAVTTTSRALIDGNNAMLRALNGGKAPATPTLVIPTNALPMVITGIPPDLDALIRAGKS